MEKGQKMSKWNSPNKHILATKIGRIIKSCIKPNQLIVSYKVMMLAFPYDPHNKKFDYDIFRYINNIYEEKYNELVKENE